jgi:hypothetical protein
MRRGRRQHGLTLVVISRGRANDLRGDLKRVGLAPDTIRDCYELAPAA